MADILAAEFDDQEVKEFLSQLDSRLKKIKNGFAQYAGLLSAIVYQDIIKHFEEEQGSGGPWEKWSTFYMEQMKLENKSGNKILQDTGRLRNSFTPQKYRKTSAGLLWYNNAKTKSGFPYAAAHDEGGSRLPKRDFMWLSSKAMDKISEQTLQFMLEKGI